MNKNGDLSAIVEQQKEQLSKYEDKLRDVIRAYKGLLKEKEALQASLSALSLPQQAPDEVAGVKQDLPESAECSSISVESNVHEVESLKKQIATLTTALSTVSSEKGRIESSFQSDKKRLLAEKEKSEKYLSDLKEAKKEGDHKAEERVSDLRSRLIVAKHEQETQNQRSNAKIRELETKLSHEIRLRERAESSLQESNLRFQQVQSNLQSLDEYEKKSNQLQAELEQVRGRLKAAEDQAKEPPMLLRLQQQIEEMQLQHTESLKQEHHRASKVEELSRSSVVSQEERVATLEAHLTDLSHSVATYERTRQQDLQSIHKLKEQVSELIQENRNLSSRKSVSELSLDSEEDVRVISRKISRLRDELIRCNLEAEHPVDVEGLLCEGIDVHAQCRFEISLLQRELDELKETNRRRLNSESEVRGDCASQLEELRSKVRSLTAAAQQTSIQHKEKVTVLTQELSKLQALHTTQLQHVESESRCAVAFVEQQLVSQQQRALVTLSDRDDEIKRLMKELQEMSQVALQGPLPNLEAAAALLTQVGGGGGDGPLLHHLEELARREQEIAGLRREKRLLEGAMREVQRVALERQQNQQETMETLQEENNRLSRNVSREGENLEYVKNIILRYMTASDGDSRQVILNAIAAILHFTPRETEGVKNHNALWWWQAKAKSPQMPLKSTRL